jgi:ubiquinone biosynthesis monooxygenase Coq6
MVEHLRTGIAEEVVWREKATNFDEARMPPRVIDIQEKSVASYPLKMRHADTYVSERVALIGFEYISYSFPLHI